MTNKSSDPNIDRSRFSWDRFLHDGQERLAALIEIEPPSAEAAPASASVEPKQSSTTTNRKPAIASVQGEVDPKKLVPGNENAGKASSNSVSSVVAMTPLEVEANLAGPCAGNSTTSGGKSSSTLDLVRRTIKRHTDQRTKETAGEPDQSATKKIDKRAKTRSRHRSKPSLDSSSANTSPTVATSATDPATDSVGTTMVDKLMDRLVTSSLPTVSFNTSDADWRAQNLKGQPPFSINLMTKNFRKMTALIYLLTPLIIQYTPWKLVFLSAGWGLAGIAHPRFREQFIVPLKLHLRDTREKGKKTLEKVVTSTRAHVANVRHKTNPSGSFASDLSATFDNASVSSHALTTDDEDHARSDEDQDNLSLASSSSSDYSDDEEENKVQEKPDTLLEKYNKFWKQVDLFARVEFNLIEPHEKREIEIFELQITYKPASATSNAPYHWSTSAFASHPYLPLTRGPVTNLNFMSCSVLAEVLAPPEWTFASWSRWKLDLDLGWVDHRGMPIKANTGDNLVEFGTNNNDNDPIVNEKWVYDKYPVSLGTGAATANSTAPALTVTTAALELLGLDDVPVEANGDKYKLFLRRRRWIRVCVRQAKLPASV
ncbi:hypothetical protein D0Z00_001986 [Geotrichum galactomycetum]|uniref:Uncharacterized protein n=1 Tax=Geotrichum galactomycetum TaxID=27317 RepID=A0ACB6V5C5_9ASCO|nr:hypothetical protein D0Z00_001986 [Geotrichum candidum]